MRGVEIINISVSEVGSITVNGRIWKFSFHRYCGPIWMKADGYTPRKCQNPKKEVWDEFERWLKKKRRKKG